MPRKKFTVHHSPSAIRECASIILSGLDRNEPVDLSNYQKATVSRAYQLLKFERLITRNFKDLKFSLTVPGALHIQKHGYAVYSGH
jgi:hypothetical protein